jgi:hypothetical protein
MEKQYKLRMYTLVPRILSPIAKGIQAGHAWIRYARKFPQAAELAQWADKDETVVVLCGGTSNASTQDGIFVGQMERAMKELSKNQIPYATFYEPDINNALTGVSFIAEERVWDLENYPQFDKWTENSHTFNTYNSNNTYEEWVKFVGGPKNAFLKTFIFSFKLAS